MKFLVVVFTSLILFSCTHRHLDEKVFKSNDITLKWYRTSEITTTHDYVDIER